MGSFPYGMKYMFKYLDKLQIRKENSLQYTKMC